MKCEMERPINILRCVCSHYWLSVGYEPSLCRPRRKFVTTLSNLIEFYCEDFFQAQRTVPYCHRFSDAKIQLKSPDMARTFLSVSSHRQHILLVSALFARNREPCARRKVQHHACLNIVLTLLVPRCKISRQEKKVSLQALSLKMKCGIHWINLHFSCPLGVVEHVVSHSKLVFINWFYWRL